MRQGRTRISDATFDLNLAPVLDIIVSIVPMLLLSVAFVQVKMIETPTPQVVSQDTIKADPNKKPETLITLKVSHVNGFIFEINQAGKTTAVPVGLMGKEFNMEGLQFAAKRLHRIHPDIFKLNLSPESDISFDELVKIMDKVRMEEKLQDEEMSISDAANAKPVANKYIFPDIVFASIGG